MDFSGASISGSPIFNSVEGDQHNKYFNGEVIYVREEKRRTKYDEFRYIISGDIYRLEEIATRDIRDLWHFPNGPTSPLQVKAQRTIYSAKLHSIDNANFTVVSYSGPDAHVAWEKDFLDFSKAQKLNTIQLFGINQSDVPALIFHDALIPVGNGLKEGSFWTDMYLHYAREHEDCSVHQLWIDTKRGRICRGPDGPRFTHRSGLTPGDNAPQVPLTMDMLKEDISFRYFTTLGKSLDRLVLKHAEWWQRSRVLSSDTEHADLRFDAVYSSTKRMLARIRCPDDLYCGWISNGMLGTLTNASPMNGITRYTFKPSKNTRISLSVKDTPESVFLLAKSWLTQALSVFDELSVALRQNEEPFLVAAPGITLQASFCQNSFADHNENEIPIYLFVRHIPPDVWSTISSLNSWLLSDQSHFWSFDSNGQATIPEDMCQRMGLPKLIPTLHIQKLTWPRYIYDAIGRYQAVRGFDSKTRDWARVLGLPILDVLEPKSKEDHERSDAAEDESLWFWAGTGDICAVAI